MSNPFSGIISKEFKAIFNNAIDSLLENNALSLPCKIIYDNSINNTYCTNCVFDNISLLSSNIFNLSQPYTNWANPSLWKRTRSGAIINIIRK